MSELPSSWTLVKIVDVLTTNQNGKPFQQGWSPQCDKRPARSDEWGVLKTTAIQEGDFQENENKRLPDTLEPKPHLVVRNGDILMTCAGPRSRCGVVCLVKQCRDKLMMSGKMYRFRCDPDRAHSEYLAYFLYSRDAQDKIDAMKTGINDSGLNLTHGRFSELDVPLPPKNEQSRISRRIEELFSVLDKGIESLRTARRQLEVYRQSVLKHAFEGKLTAQWREDNKDKLEKPQELLARVKRERVAYSERQFQEWRSAVKKWEGGDKRTNRPKKPLSPKLLSKLDEHLYPGLPHLPESWVWEKLGWMTRGVEYGTAAKSSKSGRVPVLRMGNIQNGTFDWTDLVYTSDNDEIAGYLLHDGDVLFNRTNSPELVGKTAIYRGERPAIFAGYLIRVNQISTVVESEYVNFFLNSDVARQYGNSVKTDGVNQSNINGAKLVNYPFPYCSIQEQREIVRILGEMMSIADDAEAKIHAEVERSVVLRQAILKKAFAGQLVPQDPNDEPAAILLEKIRLDREKARRGAPTARRRRKAKPVE